MRIKGLPFGQPFVGLGSIPLNAIGTSPESSPQLCMVSRSKSGRSPSSFTYMGIDELSVRHLRCANIYNSQIHTLRVIAGDDWRTRLDIVRALLPSARGAVIMDND